MKYKRLLLKLSGEHLGGKSGKGFNFDTFTELARQICALHDFGIEIGIVLGGGNFFRGVKSLPFKIDRVSGDQIGMMATAMNCVCLKESLKNLGKKVAIFTGLEIPEIGEKFNKEKVLQKLKSGYILIFSGGTGNPFFSTDTAAVLRGLEIEADLVIKGTKVDGVYDKDPVSFPTAKKFDKLNYSEILTKDLKVMDATAIALCRENGMQLSVLNISKKSDLLDFIEGKKIGTVIGP